MKYSGADWLISQGKELSPIGVKVADILGIVWQGIYHIDDAVLSKKVDWNNPHFIQITQYGSIATFDDSKLTLLVLLCHAHCVRLEISGAAHKYLRLSFYPRQRAGRMHERHPTIEQSIDSLKHLWEKVEVEA